MPVVIGVVAVMDVALWVGRNKPVFLFESLCFLTRIGATYRLPGWEHLPSKEG